MDAASGLDVIIPPAVPPVAPAIASPLALAVPPARGPRPFLARCPGLCLARGPARNRQASQS